jgi:hypothetical protein
MWPQRVGAIAAGYSLLGVFGGPVNLLGAIPVDTQRITYLAAFVLEGIGTFFLVNTVCTPRCAVRRVSLHPWRSE